MAASLVKSGPKGCSFACIDWRLYKVCPVNAISMGTNGLPVINEEKCIGCGLCVKECPKMVLALTSDKNEVHVRCRATMKAKILELYVVLVVFPVDNVKSLSF